MSNLEQTISLTGWVLNLKKLGFLTFFDLLQVAGQHPTQIVIKGAELSKDFADNINIGDLITVNGFLKEKKNKEQNFSVVEQELLAGSWQLINKSSSLPFENKDLLTLKDSTRFRYRYIDLRRKTSASIIRFKSELFSLVRRFLDEEEFKEIDTPILSPFSPEGAKTLVVPSSFSGLFYALSQSPQIFKQLLMVAGFSKYYQIAKAFRNEDARKDRQIEFLQLDLEASFLSSQQMFVLSQRMLSKLLIKVFNIKLDKISFQTLTFQHSIKYYGTDKPDLRIPLLLSRTKDQKDRDLVYLFIDSFLIPKDGFRWEVIDDILGRYPNLPFSLYDFQSDINGALIKGSPLEEIVISKLRDLHSNGYFLVAKNSGSKSRSLKAFSEFRVEIGKQLTNYHSDCFRFVWIIDWPLFERKEKGKIVSARHPFTLPLQQFVPLLNETKADDWNSLSKIISDSFDLVCNGEELASGSQRIYKVDLQRKVFQILGFNEQQIKDNFSYFLDALSFAAPPHMGIGFGIERMLMAFLNLNNIKETIPFPKNIDGSCSLTGAPNQIPEQYKQK